MKMLAIIFVLCGALAVPAFAQEAKPPEAKPGEGRQAGEMRPGRLVQKLRKNRVAREMWREMTPEQRQAVKDRLKEQREQRKAKRQEMREKWEAMTPEQRQEAKAKAKELRAEAHKKMNELRERLKDMTPEQRRAEFERLRDEFKKKRAEQK